MRTDIRHVQMIQIQLPRTLGSSIQPVVFQSAVADDERPDAQIKPSPSALVFRGQRVEHELIVRLGRCRGTIGIDRRAEQLGRRDGDTPPEQGKDVYLHRHARRGQQLPPLPVANHHIVNHQAVQKAQINLADRDLRPQLLLQCTSGLSPHEAFDCRNVQQYDERKIQSCQGPYSGVNNMFESVQFILSNEIALQTYTKNLEIRAGCPKKVGTTPSEA